MNRTLTPLFFAFGTSSLLLMDSAIKGSVILLGAACVAVMLKRDSAAMRHLVWLVAIVAMLVIPVFSLLLPRWQVLPAWAAISQSSPAIETPARAVKLPRQFEAAIAASPEPFFPGEFGSQPETTDNSFNSGALEQARREATQNSAGIDRVPIDVSWSWVSILPIVWSIGFCVLLLRLMAARWMLWGNEQRATVIAESGCPNEARKPIPHESDAAIVAAFENAHRQLGIHQRVQLLIDSERTIPVVWGIVCFRLLLPESARQWSSEQLRSVLLHELAHIKRRDTVVQLLAQFACTLHWINPLVWFASWRLHVERERACDDLVLAQGVQASAYAEHLLNVATKLSVARWTSACGLAMASRSPLESRLQAILSNRLNRRKVPVAIGIIGLLLGAGIAVPMAMLRAADDDWNPPSGTHIGSNEFSAFCVHDGKEATFVIAYRGDFDSTGRSSSNARDRTWTDSVTLTAKQPGIELSFHRTHIAPDQLSVTTAPAEDRDLRDPAPPLREFGQKEYDLAKGRVFLLSDNGSVRQLDIATPMVRDNESAIKLAAFIAAIPPQERNDAALMTNFTVQLDPPPVVGDFSNIDDPDVLLDQLANSQLPDLAPISGGGFFHSPGAPPQAHEVNRWETQSTDHDKLDPRIRRLIELGDRAVPSVHQRLNGLTASDLLATHLTLVLRSVGTTSSVPLLIKLMKTAAASDGAPAIGEFQKSFQASITQIAVTSALWKLTGRKHLFTPDQWEMWWQSVKSDFVAPLERTRPEFVSRVTPERVEALVGDLATSELAAREQLIALGPAAVPNLLKVFSVPESLIEPLSPSDTAAIRLAWVIDELGATDKLSAKLRRDYFTHRFSDDDTYAGVYPIDEDALCRALSHCSFADFCSIYLEAESRSSVPAHMTHVKWPYDIYSAYCRRFSKLVPRDTGGRTDVPHWRKVVPAENPTDEITNAVPILLTALKVERAEQRISASNLAAVIGFCTTAKPDTLIVALRDAWLAETDEKVRHEIGFAMCRFQTPFVMKEISQGLMSDRPEIVSDCAGLMDWIPIELNDETRFAFDRLVELTRHENDRVRRSATRSLASKAPQLLGPELERLCTDKVNDIREACTLALRSDPDQKHADILFKLADDAEQTIREAAFSSIANLKHPQSMNRLLPYLRDTKVHGFAVSALASMGGKDAIPLMMSELEAGNDVGGMVYQHLRLLTGEHCEALPEPWLAWWKKNKPGPTPDKDEKSSGIQRVRSEDTAK